MVTASNTQCHALLQFPFEEVLKDDLLFLLVGKVHTLLPLEFFCSCTARLFLAFLLKMLDLYIVI